MTFYLHSYPFGFRFDTAAPVSAAAQGGPYRRVARRWAENNESTLGVNVREEDEAYILSALVPGLQADDLHIQVLEDLVRIEGEYKQSTAERQCGQGG
jgi:HSP20 family molecular chaperone IbpA